MINWYWLPIAVLATFAVTFGFYGTWKMLIRKAKASLLGDFSDVKARLDVLYEKAEGDIKAEVGRIRDLIKRVLP